MKDKFYKYVKNETKKIPNSAFLYISILKVNEEDFLSCISEKYHLELINFCQDSEFGLCDSDCQDKRMPISKDKVLRDTITYHYKINNQLFLEYIVISDDLNKNHPYIVENLTVYSNDINKNELISFIQYVGDYVKNK
jgi:hypothetical protein